MDVRKAAEGDASDIGAAQLDGNGLDRRRSRTDRTSALCSLVTEHLRAEHADRLVRTMDQPTYLLGNLRSKDRFSASHTYMRRNVLDNEHAIIETKCLVDGLHLKLVATTYIADHECRLLLMKPGSHSSTDGT